MRRSLSVTFMVGVKSIYILESKVNPKVAKCSLRKSNPNNYGLNQGIISDVGFNQPNIMGEWSYSHNGYSVILSHDFGSNLFRKYGKCCPLWTTNQKIGNSCNAVTHTLLLILAYVISFNYMWSGLTPYKSRILSIFYHKNGPVWLNLFAIHTYNYYSTHLLLVSNLGGWYFAIYRSPVGQWFSVEN